MNKTLVGWIMIIVSLSSCTQSQVKLPELDKTKPILAFGDSLTAGYGTSPEYSYPSMLQKLCNCEVINAGISGETTAGGLERFEQTINQNNPSLIILMEGGNDILQSIPASITKDNLAKMITIANQHKIPLLLMAIPKKSLIGTSVADFYDEIAQQNTQILYDKDTIPQLIKKNELKSDLVHFNQQGYFIIAKKIYADLKNSGALK